MPLMSPCPKRAQGRKSKGNQRNASKQTKLTQTTPTRTINNTICRAGVHGAFAWQHMRVKLGFSLQLFGSTLLGGLSQTVGGGGFIAHSISTDLIVHYTGVKLISCMTLVTYYPAGRIGDARRGGCPPPSPPNRPLPKLGTKPSYRKYWYDTDKTVWIVHLVL